MATVTVQLPDALVTQFDSGSDAAAHALRLIALELFREEKISVGRAAELCFTPLAAFMDFAAAHGVPPVNYGLDDFESDLQTIERLGL